MKLVVVAALLVASASIERALVAGVRRQMNWLDDLGAARTSAHAIAHEALQTVVDPNDDDTPRFERIRREAESLHRYLDHNAVATADRAIGLELTPTSVLSLGEFLERSDDFLHVATANGAAPGPELVALDHASRDAIEALDASGRIVRRHHGDEIDEDLRRLYWIYTAVVAGLLLAGAFVHLPMVRQIVDDARRLHDASETMRRQMDELRSSQARTQALLDAAVDGVIVIDEHGVMESLNAAAERLFGYGAAELVGRNVAMLMPEKYVEQHVSSLSRYLRTGEKHVIGVGREVEGRRKDGSLFPLYISIGEALLPEGRRFIGIVRDVTARKAAEESLAKQTAELARSNGELEQFASVTSHDLQEPLRAIAGFSRLLAQRYKGKIDADADEFIGHVETGVLRMQELIRDLLEFSRVGRRREPFATVSTARAFDQALENLHAVVLETNPTIERGELPEVVADSVQLTQLFQNLVSNALKFRGRDPPRLRVGAERRGHEWVFFVNDNGIGLDPQFSERIFVIFQRLHTREKYAGTGIGLAICKKIVERHGGTIWVESQPDHGATFRFTLPADRSSP